MAEALGWGLLAASSLVVGAFVALLLPIHPRVLGLVMAFGSGVLIRAIAFVLAFAGGAILTMLADTMMPEAFEHGGNLAGVATTLGFATAFGLHTIP